MKKLLLFSLVISALSWSCKKDPPSILNAGIYRGVFTETRNDTNIVAEGVTYIAINENDQKFSLTSDSITNAPAQHNGNYYLMAGGKIQFENTSIPSGVYDPDHYLDTIYTYTFDDTTFHFWIQIDTILYDYDLRRY